MASFEVFCMQVACGCQHKMVETVSWDAWSSGATYMDNWAWVTCTTGSISQ